MYFCLCIRLQQVLDVSKMFDGWMPRNSVAGSKQDWATCADGRFKIGCLAGMWFESAARAAVFLRDVKMRMEAGWVTNHTCEHRHAGLSHRHGCGSRSRSMHSRNRAPLFVSVVFGRQLILYWQRSSDSREPFFPERATQFFQDLQGLFSGFVFSSQPRFGRDVDR